MGRYKVSAGQNLYDVALHLYGSIEGIVDLLMSNRNLSLSSALHAGDELLYTDGFVINADVVAYNRLHGIVPANGERAVYPKTFSLPPAVLFGLSPELISAECSLYGEGTVEIDWGDNSQVETVQLQDKPRMLTHVFDSRVREKRSVRWFTDARFRRVDWSGLRPSSLNLLRPFSAEEVTLNDASLSLTGLGLLTDTYRLELSGITTESLTPLVGCRELMELDLQGANLKPTTVDAYLLKLVERYGNRRSCTVTLSTAPTGSCREPERDEKTGRYVPVSGMEALWVILHEPAWNDGGAWRFIIGEQTYTATYGTDDQGHLS